jgi:cobalt/nickel transport system permease protein
LYKKLRHGQPKRNIVKRHASHLLAALEYAFSAEVIARQNGLLQRLDPRVKVVGLMALLVAAALSRRLSVIVAIFAAAVLLAALSRVPMKTLLKRGWIGALLFTGFIALPAVFIAPGEIVYSLPLLGLPITWNGLKSAAFLIARVETAVPLSLLLVICTPWAHALKVLRSLGVPASLVMILGMTYRYIFLLLGAARDMLEARQSRSVGAMESSEERRYAVAAIGVLLGKSLQLSNEVHLAMLARGFRGEIWILDEFIMRPRDWAALAAFAALAAGAVWLGR